MPIKAEILADSVSPAGKRITTFEINLPKVLLAEYNTHSLIARNFSSSRAIPVGKNVEIESFEPLYFGANQAGMVAKDEEIPLKAEALGVWKEIIDSCKLYSKILSDMGLHKQWANRPNDWHVMAKGVTTATEWANFLWLRNDEEAQPEIKELASLIQETLDNNIPQQLDIGEWHVPYIETRRDYGKLSYIDPVSGDIFSAEDAVMISMARCAAVSYRTENIGIEKAKDIYKKLFSGRKVHASPAMHQATPMDELKLYNLHTALDYMLRTDGVTHLDKKGNLWSGNLVGWIQNRQLIPNHYKEG